MANLSEKKQTILVIEKDLQVRKQIEKILAIDNFSTIATKNIKRALQLAKQKIPDLILCGITISDLNSDGVLAKLRQDSTIATMPIILLAATDDRLAWRRGMEMGADDFLFKPIVPAELTAAISAQFNKQAAYQERLNQELKELRTNVSNYLPHELRTPLTGIIASSDFILTELESLDRGIIRELAHCIRFSGERLGKLIENFLFYSELEQMKTSPEQIEALRSSPTSSAVAVIENVAFKQAQQAKREADLQLKLQDASLQIGTNCLGKLLEELIDNACKFSQPGTPISVTSSLKNNQFVVSVSDRGRGMTSQQIARIGPYIQFERQTYEQQGTGLGLAIAQRIAKLHQGELLIKSIPSKQTTIQVSLPKIENYPAVYDNTILLDLQSK